GGGVVVPREALVRKPVRLIAGPEAVAFGGRGAFQLLALRPPADATAWRLLEVSPRTAQPDDVLVLEIGGELSTIAQVIGTLLVAGRDGGFTRLDLALPALVRGAGVPVVLTPLTWPAVRPDAPRLFRGAAGLELLVVRSGVETMVDASVTARGPADVAPMRAGEARAGQGGGGGRGAGCWCGSGSGRCRAARRAWSWGGRTGCPSPRSEKGDEAAQHRDPMPSPVLARGTRRAMKLDVNIAIDRLTDVPALA